MSQHIPGLQLSEKFYRAVVKPILYTAYPGLVYSAALMGSGSESLVTTPPSRWTITGDRAYSYSWPKTIRP
jgi:hypothetical protein